MGPVAVESIAPEMSLKLKVLEDVIVIPWDVIENKLHVGDLSPRNHEVLQQSVVSL
jgi:hypothetical protein